MIVLGISAYYHDAAACLVRDGEIVAAAQEERFSRVRHDAAFPAAAIESCLALAGVRAEDVDVVCFYDKPLSKFERILETAIECAPSGLGAFLASMPTWLRGKLWIGDELRARLGARKVLFGEHHESHAASAFFPSPFERAAVLTVDGVGEWATTTWGVGEGNQLRLLGEIRFPHSLGLLYSAFTAFAGFRVNSGEYKLMGLAPYGEPTYVDRIFEHLIDLRDDGSFRLDLRYFDFLCGPRMTNARFARLFDGPPRAPEGPIGQREMDLARSIQVVLEEALLRLARHVHAETGERALCLAGGVALNCVANARLLRDGPFEEIWIQPAAGDAGGAVGAALGAYHRWAGRARAASDGRDGMKGARLGPAFDDDAIAAVLAREGAVFERLDRDALLARTAERLAAGEVVGWFQGRMEFGPRALGGRSILADPRVADMRAILNEKIKLREAFRPFAPAVLRERAAAWFDLDVPSPYMLLTAQVAAAHRLAPPEGAAPIGLAKLEVPLSTIPSVTHVDGSARLQTVDAEQAPELHALLEAFEARTGCPVLVNTSFNVRGEPIVCRPEEAWRCFLRTDMDALAIGSFFLDKRAQRVQLPKARPGEHGLD